MHLTSCTMHGQSIMYNVCTIQIINHAPRMQRIILSYQWAMVGYAGNMILTLVKVIFETNRVSRCITGVKDIL